MAVTAEGARAAAAPERGTGDDLDGQAE